MSAPGLQPSERADGGAASDARPLEMREGADDRAILDYDAGADHDIGLDEDVAANFRVERQKHRFGGDERRALGHCASAEPILQRGLGGGELRPVVDPHDLAFRGGKGPRDETARVGDLDDIGQVIFLLRVIGRHRLQEAQRFGPAEGDRPGVAERRSLLFGARILVLADCDQAPVALDEPAVAGRIGGPESQRDHIGALSKLRAHRRERCAPDERNVGVNDDNVVVAARNLLAGREHGMGRPPPLALNRDFRPRRDPERLGRDAVVVRPDDDGDIAGGALENRGERVRQHRLARELMQDLGPGRAHAHAFAGGKHDGQTAAGGSAHGRLLSLSRRARSEGPRRRIDRASITLAISS